MARSLRFLGTSSFLTAFVLLLRLASGQDDVSVVDAAVTDAPYWYAQIKHQGVAAFNTDQSYTVFRNVKDFGAKGNGRHDDTAAINAAIAAGNRCSPLNCQSNTNTTAVVYFPSGTYRVSSPIIDYYETQLIGNPNGLPVLKAAKNFTGIAILESNQGTGFVAGNIFYRQVRNFVFDTRAVDYSTPIMAVHWPTAQATSFQNLVFRLSQKTGTQHRGSVGDQGNGGFFSDLVINGGIAGISMTQGNPSFRNVTVNNAVDAFNLVNTFGAFFRDIVIHNCAIGVNMSLPASQEGTTTFIDSEISSTPIGFLTSFNSSSTSTASSLVVENVALKNVPVAVQATSGVALSGTKGQMTITGYGQGHQVNLSKNSSAPTTVQGTISPNARPNSLTKGGDAYYSQSKPDYASLPASSFVSARDAGAKGDGVTDDTASLQKLLLNAANKGLVVFLDAGTYKITTTLYIPAGSRIVGEGYPVIMASGSYFSDMNNPKVAVKVGKASEIGRIEWQDLVIGTQGATQGAILIEWNLASTGTASGMWDVHTRIGGFIGSNLSVEQCPTTPSITTPPTAVNSACIAAYMSMHITKHASNLYMENIWLWTADHDLDSADNDQVTIYTGRGLHVESLGPVWMFGISVEHHALYQYQFVDATDVFIGYAQSETPYYQPNPNATFVYPPVQGLNDPLFKNNGTCVGHCSDAWALRVVNTTNLLYYGGTHNGLYVNYDQTCIYSSTCQAQIVTIEGTNPNLSLYNLLAIGITNSVAVDGAAVAATSAYLNAGDYGFIPSIALVRN